MQKIVIGVTLLAFLGMAGTANAITYKWTGYAGDHLWSSNNNWDNLAPPTASDSWEVNKAGFPIANHIIRVNQNVTTDYGTFNTQPGYKANMTVLSGYTMNTAAFTMNIDAVDVVVEAGAQLNANVNNAWLYAQGGGTATVYGGIRTYVLYMNGANAILDVYGYARTYQVERIKTDPGCTVKVRSGGLFQVDDMATYSATQWNKGGKVTMFLNSTIQLKDDKTAIIANYVVAGEGGGYFESDYGVTKSGYTTIKYLPEPASLMLLVLGGLALIRRR